MTIREEQFEEVVLASEGGTIFIKTEDGSTVYLGLSKGHNVDGLPLVWVKISQRQIVTMIDFLKEFVEH